MDETKNAIEELNGHEFMGNKISVELSHSKVRTKPGINCSLMIFGLQLTSVVNHLDVRLGLPLLLTTMNNELACFTIRMQIFTFTHILADFRIKIKFLSSFYVKLLIE